MILIESILEGLSRSVFHLKVREKMHAPPAESRDVGTAPSGDHLEGDAKEALAPP